MPGKESQLKRLKSSLKQAGVIGPQSKHNISKKDRKKPRDTTKRNKIQENLDSIRSEFNPFETVLPKNTKYDVVNRKMKGVIGRPSISKMVGEEKRRKTLLVEMQNKNHVGGIIDQRFGENNVNLTLEDKMLERFTREKQKSIKSSAYNLDDEEKLTHYGQSLAFDDFNEGDLGLNDDEDENYGGINSETVIRNHFGGFNDHDQRRNLDEPKTKAEVMAELILKSKEHKMERQRLNQENEDQRIELDEELDNIRDLLAIKGPGEILEEEKKNKNENENYENYDKFMREMAFERRAKPQDRLKTEEEIAIEEKEKLEKAEKDRIKRMRGDKNESDSENEGKSKRRRKNPIADDLEDDYVPSDGDEDEDESVDMEFGKGLLSAAHQEVEEEEETDSSSDIGLKHDDDNEDGEDDFDHGENDSEDGGDDSEDDDNDDLEDPEDFENVSDIDESGNVESDTKNKNSISLSKKSLKKNSNEIPYTFSCPATHKEFLDIIGDLDIKHIPIVIQRIRALHHPSLAAENTRKLKIFLGVLIDHVFYLSTQTPLPIQIIDSLVKPIYELSKKYSIDSAIAFIEKLTLINANLSKGLNSSNPNARTFPTISELIFFKIINRVFPTSDYHHPVTTPSLILMSRYLGQCRIRHLKDGLIGLYLCQLIIEHQKLSKRLVPEAISFLQQLITVIVPKGTIVSIDCPLPDNKSNLRIRKNQKVEKSINFQTLMEPVESIKVESATIFVMTLNIIEMFTKLYTSSEAFLEIFTPFLKIFKNISLVDLPLSAQESLTSSIDSLTRMLKFATQTRKPLQLQHHRAIPIASYIPKFKENYSLDKHYDPDRDRSELKKLQTLHKKERKSAIRELRKDTQFIARERNRQRTEKDAIYQQKVRQIHGILEGDQAEKKKYEREKKWTKSK